jgi:4-hydroxy-tetrahydrodipicolinate reductase
VITLDLEMFVGLEEENDTISVEGKPSLKLTVEGVQGDIATAAMVVNAIPRVVDAPPGLVTMADLPLVCARWGPGLA